MRFKEGDKVEFIYLSELRQGVVAKIKANSFNISYLVKSKSIGTIWVTERELAVPAPMIELKQFVADWMSHCKQEGFNLFWSIDYDDSDMPYEMYEWLTSATDSQEIFARAWLDGYEVKKEPLYYVKLIDHATGYLNVYYDNAKVVGSNDGANGYKTQFTESEIKAMDKGEAYWLLKEPVEEVTE
ncbi:DUF1642 domain-containing protein [Listeria monocytogenes]|nr:DUF1642 domain-containing protein [Listeria monocytogenes]ECQ0707891.1 DUF1642 domain-containing protein [Listeria monocytogenes]EDH0919092.1 DUF1642 domain-containing protein [Listeria monocytogenes]EHZ5950843.1 DUF1642 domain-containing protein [Listeria monocytogenes]